MKKGSTKSAFQTLKWSFRDVLGTLHRQQINNLAIKLSKNAAGSQSYMAYYSKARNEVEKTLTDNQRQLYKAMAKQWTERVLPPDVQQRYVHGNDYS